MYYLQNNVEIIAGAKNYCIYELNSQKLYNMDAEYAGYLNEIVSSSPEKKNVPDNLVDYFLQSGIIVDDKALLKKPIDHNDNADITFAWIEITQNCNLTCKHCYEDATRNEKKSDMAFEDFVLAADALRSAGIKKVQLVGGEPLMHANIDQMIEYLSGKFDFIEVFTNGTLLTEKTYDLIKRNKAALAFSLYSNDSRCHDNVTCTSGSYAKTISWIERALSDGVQVRISSVEMLGTPRFEFHDKNIEHRTDFPRLCGRADLSLYSKDMLKRKLITKNTFKKPINAKQYFKNKKYHNCFSERLYIDCFLNVYPCVMERRIKLGNIRYDSIENIINNNAAKMNKDNIKECKDCEFRYACYDCRPDCREDTQIDSKPWYCTYDPYNAEWADQDQFIETL